MRATVNGVAVEGTAGEIAELIGAGGGARRGKLRGVVDPARSLAAKRRARVKKMLETRERNAALKARGVSVRPKPVTAEADPKPLRVKPKARKAAKRVAKPRPLPEPEVEVDEVEE